MEKANINPNHAISHLITLHYQARYTDSTQEAYDAEQAAWRVFDALADRATWDPEAQALLFQAEDIIRSLQQGLHPTRTDAEIARLIDSHRPIAPRPRLP